MVNGVFTIALCRANNYSSLLLHCHCGLVPQFPDNNDGLVGAGFACPTVSMGGAVINGLSCINGRANPAPTKQQCNRRDAIIMRLYDKIIELL